MLNLKTILNSKHGQALVSLLFFTIIAITISGAAIIILINNSLSGSKYEQGTLTYNLAESGVENALLRLMRDPNYTGETLLVGNGNIVSEVTPGNPITILSTGTLGDHVRKIQAQATYENYLLKVTSWKEVY